MNDAEFVPVSHFCDNGFTFAEENFTLSIEDIHPPRADLEIIRKQRLHKFKSEREKRKKNYKIEQQFYNEKMKEYTYKQPNAYFDPSWQQENKGKLGKKARRNK